MKRIEFQRGRIDILQMLETFQPEVQGRMKPGREVGHPQARDLERPLRARRGETFLGCSCRGSSKCTRSGDARCSLDEVEHPPAQLTTTPSEHQSTRGEGIAPKVVSQHDRTKASCTCTKYVHRMHITRKP